MQTEQRQLSVSLSVYLPHESAFKLHVRHPGEPQRPAPRRTEHVVNINFAPCSDARVTVATAEAAQQRTAAITLN